MVKFLIKGAVVLLASGVKYNYGVIAVNFTPQLLPRSGVFDKSVIVNFIRLQEDNTIYKF